MKKELFVTLLGIAVILACEKSYSQNDGDKKNLSEFINLALKNYMPLKAQGYEIKKSEQKYNQARSYGLPQVKAAGQGEYYFKLPVLIVPGEIFGNPGVDMPVQFGTKYNIRMGLEVGQMIYNAEYFNSLSLAKKFISLEGLKYEKSETDLMLTVAQLYYTIRMVDKQSELIVNNIKYLEKILSLTLEHFKNGLSKKIDADRVSVSLVNLQAEFNNLATTRTELANQLKTITCSDSIPMSSDSTALELPLSIDRLVCDTSSSLHIDSRIAEKQTELSGLLIRQAWSKLQPTLSAFAGYSYQAQVDKLGSIDSSKDWTKIPMVGLKLEIPIFSGLEKRASVKLAEFENKQAFLSSAFTEQNLNSEKESIRAKLKSNYYNVKMQKQNLNLSQSVRDITAEQYEQGLVPLIELISAETQLNGTRSSYFQSLLQFRMVELEWYRITDCVKENLLK